MIDMLKFFHQATIKICGSLDINTAVLNCTTYLREYIPIGTLILSTYEPEREAIRVLAMSPRTSESWSIPIHLPFDGRTCLEDLEDGIGLLSGPQNSVGRLVNESLGIDANSAILMLLKVDKKDLGVVSIVPQAGAVFTDEHIRLMKLLHDPFAVALANVLRHREILRLKDLLADDNSYLQQELRNMSGSEIVGARFGLRHVMDMVRLVAPLDSPVLLLGETGVGKELVANAIHSTSSRRDGPLVKVNCGAFVDSLLDSELFGHERGAFTGAIRAKRGRFERADGGTLFLDELGELPPGAQVRLLRVLQDGVIERVGGTDSVKVDVRVVAATHADLHEMARQGRFREDLLFRLNVFPLQIPPLRERKSDIPALVHYFIDRKLAKFNLRAHPVLASGAMAHLMEYKWPGNVRELENIVERALIRHQGSGDNQPLLFENLTNAPRSAVVEPHGDGNTDRPLTLDAAMRHHIEDVLSLTGGKIQGEAGAAAILGLHPSTLRSRMTKLRIPFGRVARKDHRV